MFPQIALAFGISLIGTVVIMPMLIPFLHKIKYGQSVSEYSLEGFKEKQGTPTMGGALFVILPIVVLCVFHPKSLQNSAVLLIILSYFGYGLIGFIDDYIIVIQKDNRGLPAWLKFGLQLLLAILFFVFYQENASTAITIPFFNIILDLKWMYAFLVFFMFTGASNAVNLTDGMDGLAAGTSLLAFSPFVFFAIQQQQYEIAIFIVAIMGALIGYLFFNMHPAKIFMGDTGSLALGGVLAALAMVLKQEVALIIIGGVFVYETLCVIIQIGSVKIRKKKVFKYTPIHYSFVLSGFKETQVVLLFWIMGLICAILGFVIGVI